MRRINQVASVLFFALGLFLVAESRRYTYYADIGPGPGFFPFWLGVAVAALSALWFLQASLQPEERMPTGFIPDRSGVARVLAILVASLLLVLFVDVLGFQLAMLGYMLFLVYGLGRQNVLVTVLVSLAGSFGLYYAFDKLLDVSLPLSTIDFLQNLGL